MKFVEGDDFHLLVGFAVELAVVLMIHFHGNFRFAFDDMEIRDQITVGVDEKS